MSAGTRSSSCFPEQRTYLYKAKSPTSMGALYAALSRFDVLVDPQHALVRDLVKFQKEVSLDLILSEPPFFEREMVMVSGKHWLTRRDANELLVHWLYNVGLAGSEPPPRACVMQEEALFRLSHVIYHPAAPYEVFPLKVDQIQRIAGLHVNFEVTRSDSVRRFDAGSSVPTICGALAMIWCLVDHRLPSGPLASFWDLTRSVILQSGQSALEMEPCYRTPITNSLIGRAGIVRKALIKFLGNPNAEPASDPEHFVKSCLKRLGRLENLKPFMERGRFIGHSVWVGHDATRLGNVEAVNKVSKEGTREHRRELCELLNLDLGLFEKTFTVNLDLSPKVLYFAWCFTGVALWEVDFLLREVYDIPEQLVRTFDCYNYVTQVREVVMCAPAECEHILRVLTRVEAARLFRGGKTCVTSPSLEPVDAKELRTVLLKNENSVHTNTCLPEDLEYDIARCFVEAESPECMGLCLCAMTNHVTGNTVLQFEEAMAVAQRLSELLKLLVSRLCNRNAYLMLAGARYIRAFLMGFADQSFQVPCDPLTSTKDATNLMKELGKTKHYQKPSKGQTLTLRKRVLLPRGFYGDLASPAYSIMAEALNQPDTDKALSDVFVFPHLHMNHKTPVSPAVRHMLYKPIRVEDLIISEPEPEPEPGEPPLKKQKTQPSPPSRLDSTQTLFTYGSLGE